jgi:gamma-glutamylputrescine oxidase
MGSYWLEETDQPLPRRSGSGAPDVEIVGGGVTGCSCALVLAEAGLRVRLHEAREIASGASGRNGGFALRGGAMAYDVARRQLGRDRHARTGS